MMVLFCLLAVISFILIDDAAADRVGESNLRGRMLQTDDSVTSILFAPTPGPTPTPGPRIPTFSPLTRPTTLPTPVPSLYYIKCHVNCPKEWDHSKSTWVYLPVNKCGFFEECGNACYCGTLPAVPSPNPTRFPTVSSFQQGPSQPSFAGGGSPTMIPFTGTGLTGFPTSFPVTQPTLQPTRMPSPTLSLRTASPSSTPTLPPTSSQPTLAPSFAPTLSPTQKPSFQPTPTLYIPPGGGGLQGGYQGGGYNPAPTAEPNGESNMRPTGSSSSSDASLAGIVIGCVVLVVFVVAGAFFMGREKKKPENPAADQAAIWMALAMKQLMTAQGNNNFPPGSAATGPSIIGSHYARDDDRKSFNSIDEVYAKKPPKNKRASTRERGGDQHGYGLDFSPFRSRRGSAVPVPTYPGYSVSSPSMMSARGGASFYGDMNHYNTAHNPMSVPYTGTPYTGTPYTGIELGHMAAHYPQQTSFSSVDRTDNSSQHSNSSLEQPPPPPPPRNKRQSLQSKYATETHRDRTNRRRSTQVSKMGSSHAGNTDSNVAPAASGAHRDRTNNGGYQDVKDNDSIPSAKSIIATAASMGQQGSMYIHDLSPYPVPAPPRGSVYGQDYSHSNDYTKQHAAARSRRRLSRREAETTTDSDTDPQEAHTSDRSGGSSKHRQFVRGSMRTEEYDVYGNVTGSGSGSRYGNVSRPSRAGRSSSPGTSISPPLTSFAPQEMWEVDAAYVQSIPAHSLPSGPPPSTTRSPGARTSSLVSTTKSAGQSSSFINPRPYVGLTPRPPVKLSPVLRTPDVSPRTQSPGGGQPSPAPPLRKAHPLYSPEERPGGQPSPAPPLRKAQHPFLSKSADRDAQSLRMPTRL